MVEVKGFCGDYLIQYRFYPGGGQWKILDIVPFEKITAYLDAIENASREVRAIPYTETSYAVK
jgi:hypothetical protein